MAKFQIVHAPSDNIETEKVPSIFCKPGTAFVLQDKANFEIELVNWRKFELERNEWIRKYDNVLKGLKYWQEKALQND